MLTATAFDDRASRQILLGSPLGKFLERLLTLRAAAGLRMTGGGYRGVSPSALLRSLLAIGGRELDFKLMDLIPLGISALTLRYRQKLSQASVGGHRLWCVHDGIIPSLNKSPSWASGPIASVSFGATRTFELFKRTTGKVAGLPLTSQA